MLRIITAVLIVSVAIPAYAQGMSGGRSHHPPEQKAGEQKKKPDDKSYNSSLATVPDRKFDPWQKIR